MNVLWALGLAALALGPQTRSKLITHKNLSILPVYEQTVGKIPNYITLDEGLKAGTVIVEEKGGDTPVINRRQVIRGQVVGGRQRVTNMQAQATGPEVNGLWLTNKSGRPLLLLAGELVRGGHQDRIIQGDTIVVSSKTPVNLDVFCVEHGRWSPNKETIGPGSLGFGSFGGAMVAPTVRGSAVVSKSQQQVWDATDRTLTRLNTTNESSAYRMNLESKPVQIQTDAYEKAILGGFPNGDVTGVIVAINGKPAWMDSFANHTLFAKYWPKLLKSYALEALSASEKRETAPVLSEMLEFAKPETGKTEIVETPSVVRLTRIETNTTVMTRLEDLSVKKALIVHQNKMRK